MSLCVWLPLTKDLRQQGLSNVTVTNNGATFNSAGKLGGCYSVDNVKQIGRNNCLNLGTTFSIAFWSKINSKNVDWGNIFKIYKDGADYIGMCLAYTTDANPKLGFHIYRNNGSNAREAVIDGYKEYSLNNWFHTVITVTPTKAIVYKDGVVFNTFTINKTFPSITNYSLWLGKNGIGNGLDCSINDFRIYDHCLSPMEVKELAKGLVLHYPLNRQGWGQENNIKTSIVQNRGCSNFVYNSSTNEWTMTCPTGSTTWGYGIVLNDRTIAWKSGESWLVSMEVYTPRAIRWQMDINNKPDLADISSYTGNDYDDQRVVNTNGVQGSYQLQAGWNKLWFTQRAPSTYGLTNYSTNWGVVTTNETSTIDIKIKNIKGEVIGSGLALQPTPWCPNSADTIYSIMSLNGTTEYDCSGFCNNGTRSGTFSWTSDTPKYCVSTNLTGNTSKIHISDLVTSGFANSYSFAWWGKVPTWSNKMQWGFSDGVRLNGIYNGTLWNTGDGSNNPLYNPGTTTQVTAPTTNVWHHYVMVGDGNTCKVYKDGELWAQAKTYKAISGTSIWLNGWQSNTDYSYDVGYQMSDFRIYATALSADDVKSLYQNCATIDPDGTIRGQIRS